MYLHSVSVRAKRLEAVWDHLCEPKASALGVFAYRASPSAASGRCGVACILQGNVAPEREKRQGGSELKRGQGMGKVREKFNGWGGIESQPQNMSHHELSSLTFFFLFKFPFLSSFFLHRVVLRGITGMFLGFSQLCSDAVYGHTLVHTLSHPR